MSLAGFIAWILVALTLTTGPGFAQVQTKMEDCTIDWSEGVIHAMGVGRANYDSSIARPSRNALFKSALEDVKGKLRRAIASLWRSTPLFENRSGAITALVEQTLLAHPPKIQLYSDGSVHAFVDAPLSRLEGITPDEGVGESAPVVVKVPSDYLPTLGAIFCMAGMTKSISQARITLHDAYQDLPTFLRSTAVTNTSAQFDKAFQCLRLDESRFSKEVWLHLSSNPRIYIVRTVHTHAL
ncbi:MAG: hypothetical protein ACPGQS_14420 [Bradymonadia bacterium]